jgi:hypothetical protein
MGLADGIRTVICWSTVRLQNDKVIQAAHGAIHNNNKKDNNIGVEFGGVQS